MEISQLRSFLCVAHEGNVTRAADALYLSQPAVTQQIRALERELGASLFDRTGRGVQLTAAGTALRDYVRRSLALLEEGQQVIADLHAGTAGRLLLGAGVTTSIFSLPAWLREFREAYPAVDVTVRTGESMEVTDMVLEREVDLGVITSPVEFQELRTISLFDEEIALVAPPQLFNEEILISIEKFSEIPLILFPQGSGFRAYLDRVLANAGFTASIKMETDSVEAIKSFVAVGLGASFLPISAIEQECKTGILKRLEVKGLGALSRTTYITYRADRYRSVAAGGFLEILKKRYEISG